jgi:hypothetical protein
MGFSDQMRCLRYPRGRSVDDEMWFGSRLRYVREEALGRKSMRPMRRKAVANALCAANGDTSADPVSAAEMPLRRMWGSPPGCGDAYTHAQAAHTGNSRCSLTPGATRRGVAMGNALQLPAALHWVASPNAGCVLWPDSESSACP